MAPLLGLRTRKMLLRRRSGSSATFVKLARFLHGKLKMTMAAQKINSWRFIEQIWKRRKGWFGDKRGTPLSWEAEANQSVKSSPKNRFSRDINED